MFFILFYPIYNIIQSISNNEMPIFIIIYLLSQYRLITVQNEKRNDYGGFFL